METILSIIIVSVLFGGIFAIALVSDPADVVGSKTDRHAVEDAWRIKEITDTAREELYSEIKRQRWGKDE